MNFKNVAISVLISIAAFILMVLSFVFIGGTLGMLMGSLLPLIAYIIVFKFFKEEFWTSFFISLVFLAVILLGGLKLFVFK